MSSARAVGEYFLRSEVVSIKSRWLAGLLFLIPLAVIAQSTKLAPELKQLAAGKTISVIVQYKSAALSAQVKNLPVGNATVSAQLQVINGLRLVVPVAELASLAADPNVTYVSPDRKVHGHLNNAAPAVLANYAWGLGLSGTGIGVAVIDSGIHEADDLNQTGSGSRIEASLTTPATVWMTAMARYSRRRNHRRKRQRLHLQRMQRHHQGHCAQRQFDQSSRSQ